MVRDVNLIEYLPEFLRVYREFIILFKAMGEEVQICEDETEIIFNNQFINDCNEKGIEKFEKLLGIIPNSFDNLQGRISRVLQRWNDSLPYTYRNLIEKLNNLCGEGNYLILPEFEKYKLKIVVQLPLSSQVEELELYMKTVMPANIEWSLENRIIREPKTYSNLCSVTVQRIYRQIETNEVTDIVERNVQKEISITDGVLIKLIRHHVNNAEEK